MEYKLSPAGKERLDRIAERNALPPPVALEALLLLADLGEWRLESGVVPPKDAELEKRRQIPIASLTISTRLTNALLSLTYGPEYKGRMTTVAELAAIPLAELMRARNMGKKSLKEWSDCLVKFGYPPL